MSGLPGLCPLHLQICNGRLTLELMITERKKETKKAEPHLTLPVGNLDRQDQGFRIGSPGSAMLVRMYAVVWSWVGTVVELDVTKLRKLRAAITSP